MPPAKRVTGILTGERSCLWRTPNRAYTIQSTTSLVHAAFAPLATEQFATPPENSHVGAVDADQKFYRILLD